jgi:hypothetical protein
MKITYVLSCTIIAFAIGFKCCDLFIEHSNGAIIAGLESDAPNQKCDLALRTLVKLRAEDTNTLPFLETELDVGIIDLGNVLSKEKPSAWSEADKIVLQRAKDYRRRFPRKWGTAEIGEGVTNVLSMIN